MSSNPSHAPSLVETDQAYADADAGKDHMGRRHAATIGEAFRQDLPWIAGLLIVVAFDIAALAGYFR